MRLFRSLAAADSSTCAAHQGQCQRSYREANASSLDLIAGARFTEHPDRGGMTEAKGEDGVREQWLECRISLLQS